MSAWEKGHSTDKLDSFDLGDDDSVVFFKCLLIAKTTRGLLQLLHKTLSCTFYTVTLEQKISIGTWFNCLTYLNHMLA